MTVTAAAALRLIRNVLRRRRADERGLTVVEVSMASSILLISLAVFFGSLTTTQQTTAFAEQRHRAFDQLRITADVFAKDIRQAVSINVATPSLITMETYVNQVVTTVTYRVVTEAGQRNLKRTQGAATSVFVVKLTDSAVFGYDSDVPNLVRRVRLLLTTIPDTRYGDVSLSTEVALRNVS